MLGNVLTSRTVRSLIATSPRGRSRAARMISRRYPKAQIFNLVGPLSSNSMYLDTSDPFQADMAYGAYQTSVVERILRLARRGDVVLTAGAQLGYMALALAQAVGLDGKVLAFEADPRMVEKCSENLSLNKSEGVRLVPVALGSSNGELDISLSSTAGQSSFAIAHHHLRYTRVPVRTGDEVLADLGITRLDGIVLDVEGWEVQVLRGLSRTLSNHLPRWAIVECWDVALKAANSSAQELLRELERLGWETSGVDGGVIGEGGDVVCSAPDV
jgi:FkbM family methyltransferase